RIPSDIAEGCGRWNLLDFRHFLRDARGSAYEVETQLLIAQRQGYISVERVEQLTAQCLEVTRLINGLIRYVEKRICQLSTANFVDQSHEFPKQVKRVMRPRRRLRVVLDGQQRLAAVAEAFQRLIVQVDVRVLDVVFAE